VRFLWCLVSLSISSCVDLPLLYDTLVHFLFNSVWDRNTLAWDDWDGCFDRAGKLPDV
jgi:hypothetical protein